MAHVQTHNGNKNIETSEHHFYKKPAIIALAGAVALGGIGVTLKSMLNREVTSQLPGTSPIVEKHTTGTETLSKPLTAEMKSFKAEFGARYKDPIATYFADSAYKSQNEGRSSVLTDNYIDNYITQRGPGTEKTTELGFIPLMMSNSVEMDRKSTIDLFNNDVCKNLSTYMNLVSKNRSSKALEDINNQYSVCASDYNNLLKDSENERFIQDLLVTLRNFVNKYDTNSNFTILPGSENANDNISYFDPAFASGTRPGAKSNQVDGLNMAVKIDTYDNEGNVKSDIAMMDPISLIVKRLPIQAGASFTYITVGRDN